MTQRKEVSETLKIIQSFELISYIKNKKVKTSKDPNQPVIPEEEKEQDENAQPETIKLLSDILELEQNKYVIL